jgi:hypothetical protein
MERDFKVEFIGIGTPKSGTTWLFYCLGQHPEICLSEPKEVRYFNEIDLSKRSTKSQGNAVINKNFSKRLSWYKKHFNHCHRNTIKGEFSPAYLYDEIAPSKISKYFPNVKLLLCLRNPIDRLYSTYWNRRIYSRREDRSFEDVIRNDQIFLEGSFYYKYLCRYLQHFSSDQIMVVLFDDILNDPEQEIKNVFGFLGVDTSLRLNLSRVSQNSAKRSRFGSIVTFMEYISNLLIERDRSELLRYLRKAGVKKLVLKMGTADYKYPDMKPEARQYLRSIFKEDIAQLESYLNRDLSHWR